MTDYPSESSLVVNATQQQLSQSPFTAGVAIAPSQREEAEGGYDIAFDTAQICLVGYVAKLLAQFIGQAAEDSKYGPRNAHRDRYTVPVGELGCVGRRIP